MVGGNGIPPADVHVTMVQQKAEIPTHAQPNEFCALYMSQLLSVVVYFLEVALFVITLLAQSHTCETSTAYKYMTIVLYSTLGTLFILLSRICLYIYINLRCHIF
jgi:hypothetical protein